MTSHVTYSDTLSSVPHISRVRLTDRPARSSSPRSDMCYGFRTFIVGTTIYSTRAIVPNITIEYSYLNVPDYFQESNLWPHSSFAGIISLYRTIKISWWYSGVLRASCCEVTGSIPENKPYVEVFILDCDVRDYGTFTVYGSIYGPCAESITNIRFGVTRMSWSVYQSYTWNSITISDLWHHHSSFAGIIPLYH